MVIVSQNKNGIINFKNIETLVLIKRLNKNGVEAIQINARGNYDYNLGEYKTAERAKEIIAEITLAYSNFTYFKTATKEGKDYIINLLKHKYEKFDIYEMPKE